MTPYDCAVIRRLEERYTGCDLQCGYTLMQRAGFTAAQIINSSSDGFDRIVLLAGKGNNGGEKYNVILCDAERKRVLDIL